MKKQKLIIRILAIVLLVVMVLGMIVPYVSASEVSDVEQPNVSDIPMPDYGLPDGFEYELNGYMWEVVKSNDNDKPAIMLNARPDSFDAPKIVVFVGNLETYKVRQVELYHGSNYVASMDLDDGYYVVFTNNYAWCDSAGDAYAINGGLYQFIYIGDNYDPTLYGVEFEQTTGIFSLSLDNARPEMEAVAYGSTPLINEMLLTFPEDAKLEKRVDEPQKPIETTPSAPQETTPVDDHIPGDESKSIFQILWELVVDFVGGSPFLIIGIVGCFVGIKVIEIKKKAKAAQQIENDRYDERRID